MAVYGLNSQDIFIKGLKLASTRAAITNAVVTATLYDETQFELLDNGGVGTGITGATNVSLAYQAPTTEEPTTGHYRGSIAASVGLTIGTRVRVNFKDNGVYGFNVWRELTVQRRVVS